MVRTSGHLLERHPESFIALNNADLRPFMTAPLQVIGYFYPGSCSLIQSGSVSPFKRDVGCAMPQARQVDWVHSWVCEDDAHLGAGTYVRVWSW
jgi:hypothetical protein